MCSLEGQDSEGSVLLERKRLGVVGNVWCLSVRNLQGQFHMRTIGEHKGPAPQGPSEEGKLCGWGRGAQPASKISRFPTLD